MPQQSYAPFYCVEWPALILRQTYFSTMYLSSCLKFFFIVSCNFKVNDITITKNHPQANCQAQQFNSSIVSRFCFYVFKHQTGLDTYLLQLTSKYNVQVHRSIKVDPLRLAPARAPPGPVTVVSKHFSLASDKNPAYLQYAILELKRWATSLTEEADKNLCLLRRAVNATTTTTLGSLRFSKNFKRFNWTGSHFFAPLPRSLPLRDILSCCQKRKDRPRAWA